MGQRKRLIYPNNVRVVDLHWDGYWWARAITARSWEANANVEEASAQPSNTLLEKLAVKMDKLEAFEKLTTDITEIKSNQQIIIDILTHR